jgi:hypothetical protein
MPLIRVSAHARATPERTGALEPGRESFYLVRTGALEPGRESFYLVRTGALEPGRESYWYLSSSTRISSIELKRFVLSTDIARITSSESPLGSAGLISCGGRALPCTC